MINKVCQYCKKEFSARYSDAKYCSQHCSGKATSHKTQFKLGHIQSESSRKKMSDKKIGHIPWNKSKSIPTNSGRTHFVKGVASWNKGTKGLMPVPWNKGVGTKTTEAQRLRTSIPYKEWRKSVFERDRYTCQECGEVGGKLNADHIKRFSEFPELRFDINNGKTLCESCHRKTKTFGNRKIAAA